jgi:hypothetical protein
MKTVKRRKVPVALVHRLRVEIDPYSLDDQLVLA